MSVCAWTHTRVQLSREAKRGHRSPWSYRQSPSESLTTGPSLQRPFSPFFLFFPLLLFLLCQNLAGELSLALKSLLDLKLIAVPLPPPQKCWDSKCVVLSMPDSVLSFSVCNPHSTKPEGPCPSSRLGSATAFPYPRGSSCPL